MIVTKLTLMWATGTEDFEFAGIRMFKATDAADANRICYESGRYVEWDEVSNSIEEASKYLDFSESAAADFLQDEIRENLREGATFIRLRAVEQVVELWMAL